jgi:acyl-CoA synthetase (AMP-forming)/AMP-acid ligase II
VSAYAIGRRRDSNFEIVDTNGQPSPAGEFGIVRIRNNYMVSSYVIDLPSANSTFRDGWFYPGDIASEDETGRIQFQTRLDHIVNIGGEKVNAYTIDMIFRSTRGIRDAVVFRNPKEQAIDELFAFVVFDQNANRIQAIESAKYAICERFGEQMVPRVIRPVAGIPRKQDGSPDRKACADYVLHISSGDRAASTS